MIFNRATEMFQASRLTRQGRLADATSLLQRLLGFHGATGATGTASSMGSAGATGAASPPRPAARIVDIDPDTGEVLPGPVPRRPHASPAGQDSTPPGAAKTAPSAGLDNDSRSGQFVARSYTGPEGSRAYKLFIPAAAPNSALPLIVMLHGCTQSPDDFAIGTGMNRLAATQGCLVAYPAQSKAANAHKCWNWFNPADQRRGQGEPAVIAGITREIMSQHQVDPRRIYVAGLSAGGATAALMGAAYPDLYAAIGVHSGLPCGAARDLPSALAAMRDGAATRASPSAGRPVPCIVFHADKDTTVHPRNADQIVAQSAGRSGLQATVTRGQAQGGRAYTRSVYSDAEGRAVLEQWLVHGGGHAWAGGDPKGTYTDPSGPDASREMLRFFLANRLPG